ncbi:hypothetical protein KAU33_11365 [Candidatus Dependentiae bacterium]|nr:hypothetical protein [Candidatus Dependentiae bacterium]
MNENKEEKNLTKKPNDDEGIFFNTGIFAVIFITIVNVLDAIYIFVFDPGTSEIGTTPSDHMIIGFILSIPLTFVVAVCYSITLLIIKKRKRSISISISNQILSILLSIVLFILFSYFGNFLIDIIPEIVVHCIMAFLSILFAMYLIQGIKNLIKKKNKNKDQSSTENK